MSMRLLAADSLQIYALQVLSCPKIVGIHCSAKDETMLRIRTIHRVAKESLVQGASSSMRSIPRCGPAMHRFLSFVMVLACSSHVCRQIIRSFQTIHHS